MRVFVAAFACAFSLCLAGCVQEPVSGHAFAEFETMAKMKGGLREERRPLDAPFSNADLLQNFDRIAFSVEDQFAEGNPQVDHVRRWEAPIRWRLRSIGPDVVDHFRLVHETFERLSAVTGLDIAPAAFDETENMFIFFARPEDFDPELERWRKGEADEGLIDFVRAFSTNRTTPCQGVLYRSDGQEPDKPFLMGEINYALVVIRAGLTPASRRTCAEEELAQSLGLTNDHPGVRPSLFNDDEEFALLTEHDEFLLRLLYDRRLRAGMDRAKAMRLLPEILAELRPNG
ncbi:MAG: DUF2927 domain-containing protein [Pseudomonadota bacterium]